MSLLLSTWKKLLCRIFGYYENGTVFRLLYTSSGIQFEARGANAPLPLILIVSRIYYQERVNKYPVEDKKSLAKILAMELDAHYEKYLITNVEGGQSYVNIWSFEKGLPNARMIIPETFLLQQQLTNNAVIIKESKAGKLFIAAFNCAVSSLFSSNFINSVERFGLSIGQNLGQVIPLNEQQMPDTLIDSILKTKKQQLLAFITKQKDGEASPISLRSLVIPTMLIVGFYFLFTSLWLVWKNNELEQSFSEQRAALENALEVQNDFVSLENELIVLDDFLSKQHQKSTIWLVLHAIADNTTISACRLIDGRFILVGETEKATNLLEKISKMSGIQDAKFDVPIRITKKAENFNISFIFTDSSGRVGRTDAEIN